MKETATRIKFKKCALKQCNIKFIWIFFRKKTKPPPHWGRKKEWGVCTDSSRASLNPCCYRQTVNHCITTSDSSIFWPLKDGKFLQNVASTAINPQTPAEKAICLTSCSYANLITELSLSYCTLAFIQSSYQNNQIQLQNTFTDFSVGIYDHSADVIPDAYTRFLCMQTMTVKLHRNKSITAALIFETIHLFCSMSAKHCVYKVIGQSVARQNFHSKTLFYHKRWSREECWWSISGSWIIISKSNICSYLKHLPTALLCHVIS